MASLVLWVAGVGLVVLAVLQARGPFARMGELDRLAENARKYDSWRGGRRPGVDEGPSSAEIMRDMLRRKVMIWAVAGTAGVVLIITGFMLR